MKKIFYVVMLVLLSLSTANAQLSFTGGAPTVVNATSGNVVMYSCTGDPLVCTFENAGGAINLVTTGYSDIGVNVVTSTDAAVTVSGMSRVYINGDDDVITFNLPAVPTNKVFCFGNNSFTNAITVNPDDSDYITLDGITASQGEAVVSSGNKKDWICVIGLDASNWKVTGFAGTWAEEIP